MSDFRIDQITNQAGTAGPDIAGITTFSGSSGLLMPSGDTRGRYSGADGEIVKDGLVLWLDAGRAESYGGDGTTWRDLSGNGNNGTLLNGVGFSAEEGGSLIFDGSDDFIETTYTPGNISSQTISCWINKSNLQYSLILAKSTLYYGLEIYPTIIYVNITNTQYGQVSYNTNGWQNIVFTYDGNQTGNSNRLKIYFNGDVQTLTFTGTIPSSANVSDVIQIGRRWWASLFSEGSIAQVSIYNRALSAAEIQQNYNALKGRYT